MTRMMDLIASMNNGSQAPSYEFMAFEDFKQNNNQYKFVNLVGGKGQFNV